MATENIEISTDWTQLVDASTENFLISWNSTSSMQIASTAGSNPPGDDIVGHVLTYSEAMTRNTLGAGTVWAKASSDSNIKVVVTKS